MTQETNIINAVPIIQTFGTPAVTKCKRRNILEKFTQPKRTALPKKDGRRGSAITQNYWIPIEKGTALLKKDGRRGKTFTQHYWTHLEKRTVLLKKDGRRASTITQNYWTPLECCIDLSEKVKFTYIFL